MHLIQTLAAVSGRLVRVRFLVHSLLRLPERVNLRADGSRAGEAALPLPDRERALERFTRLVDPACALEHGGEVFVGVRLEPDAVRLGLRSDDCRAGQRLRLLELASLASRSASAAAAFTRMPNPRGGMARG